MLRVEIMEEKIKWIIISFLLSIVFNACDRNKGQEVCVLTTLTDTEGDTLTTLEYEEGKLVRINERNPVSVRRFLYDNSLLVKEEFFGSSSILQRYRSYFYEDTSRLVEMIEYQVNLSGEWVPAYRERYSDFSGKFPGVLRAYSILDNEEILASYCDLNWRDGALTRLRRWEQVPSAPDRLRVVEVRTFTYDSRPSPWPDIPVIEIWKRVRNPLAIDSRRIEYLPQGNTVETLSRKSYEYRYDKESKVIETLTSDPSEMDIIQEFRYSCVLPEP